MIDKLQVLEDRFLDLEHKIADPDVIADQMAWQKAMKARAELEEVVTVFREYKNLLQQYDDAKLLLEDTDFELKEHVNNVASLEVTNVHKSKVPPEWTRKQTLTNGERYITEELKELEPKLADMSERLKILLLPKDPNDNKNVIVEIRGGTGGEEAALFAADLFRMYSRYAEGRGWRVEVMDSNPTGIGGYKEIVFLVF